MPNFKKITIIITIVILAGLISLGIYFGSNHEQEKQPIVLNQKTAQYFEGYIVDFLKHLDLDIDNQDLILSDELKNSLKNIQEKLSPENRIILNGEFFSELEIVSDEYAYYIKPVGHIGESYNYLEAISKDKIDIEKFYNPTDLKDQILRIFYDEIKNKEISSSEIYLGLEPKIKNILDSKIKEGLISNYQINTNMDSILITFANDDMPYEVKPYEHASAMKFVTDSYDDPLKYANEVLLNLEKQLTDDKILIINTNAEPYLYNFYERERIENDINVLLDSSLSKDEKLNLISGSVRISEDEIEETVSSNKINFISKAFALETDLINSPGTIVPTKKVINYYEAPEYYFKIDEGNFKVSDFFKQYVQNHTIKDLLNPSGLFKIFHKNGYTINTTVVSRNEKAVERMQDLFSKSGDILYFHGHGDNCAMLSEIYEIGPVGSIHLEPYSNNLKKFIQRRDELWNKYSREDFIIGLRERSLPDMITVVPGMVQKLERSLDSKDVFGVVWVMDSFFEKYAQKKTLFIAYSCRAGCLKDVVPARVMLAADSETNANTVDFPTDLEKISKYIFKENNINTDLININNMRNYDIVPDLNLTQIKLYGESGQTISVSPHVQSSDGTEITFNAPMETSIKAEDVVTIDASQCQNVSKESIDLKPKWNTEGNMIKLPWMDKVYREWKSTDFALDGFPKFNRAIITVKNDKAVSQTSKINLTGNTDCSVRGTSAYPECWQEPDTIKYNGNKPNTDFTFSMICLDEIYYKSCEEETDIIKITNDNIEDDKPFGSNYIKVDGKCYNKIEPNEHEKTIANKIEKWTEGKGCSAECLNESSDCFSHILDFRKSVKDRFTFMYNGKKNTEITNTEGEDLYVDDKLEPSCIETVVHTITNNSNFSVENKCSDAAAYANNTAWIQRNTEENLLNGSWTVTEKIIYNGKQFDSFTYSGDANLTSYSDPRSINNLQLYKDHIGYIKDGKVFYNGKDYGVVDDYDSFILFGDTFYSSNHKNKAQNIDQIDYISDYGVGIIPTVNGKKLYSEQLKKLRSNSTTCTSDDPDYLKKYKEYCDGVIGDESFIRVLVDNGKIYFVYNGGSYNIQHDDYSSTEYVGRRKFFDGINLISLPPGEISVLSIPKVSLGNFAFKSDIYKDYNIEKSTLFYNLSEIAVFKNKDDNFYLDINYELDGNNFAYVDEQKNVIYNGNKLKYKFDNSTYYNFLAHPINYINSISDTNKQDYYSGLLKLEKGIILFKKYILFKKDSGLVLFDNKSYRIFDDSYNTTLHKPSVINNLLYCRLNDKENQPRVAVPENIGGFEFEKSESYEEKYDIIHNIN